MCSVPQQLGFALQAVQQLDLAVHAGDLVLQVLAGHVHLLAELRKHTRQLPEETHTALREDQEVLAVWGSTWSLKPIRALRVFLGPRKRLTSMVQPREKWKLTSSWKSLHSLSQARS
ncbi:hypothetical protein EYF80_054290 [Liparis tanakae]|uniref:Uncharacterized protein n=1 Tax=Liparis tanakae TaxID=230148 RepID=A0A4Z2F504_9TELE|nr:hypothetical protein EYF80_054290 [Liparis tanakae]